jgi:hypothetical protein
MRVVDALRDLRDRLFLCLLLGPASRYGVSGQMSGVGQTALLSGRLIQSAYELVCIDFSRFELREKLLLESLRHFGDRGEAELPYDLVEASPYGGVGDSKLPFDLLDIAARLQENLDELHLLGREDTERTALEASLDRDVTGRALELPDDHLAAADRAGPGASVQHLHLLVE